MTIQRPAVLSFALAFVSALVTSDAAAETTQCTAITTLPYTINAPGAYCLTVDLSTPIATGSAITINSNSVTLDLNGRKLAGSAGSGTEANGVLVNGRRFVVVKNGTIRGFMYGVYVQAAGAAFDTSVGNIVEALILERNHYGAIRVEGIGCVVRNNLLVSTGGTTFFGASANGVAIGAFGSGNSIRDNDITGVVGTGTGIGYGVLVNTSHDTLIEGNRIATANTGIYVGGNNVLVVSNRFTNMPTGILYTSIGNGKYRDNLTAGVTTLAIGGIDAGGNN
jgi:hypothetical protein